MTNLTTREEELKCRNRVNPPKDATLMYSKSGVCDDYTCTKVKSRKNDLNFIQEVERLTSEVWDEL